MPHYICRIGVATLAFIWQHFITVNKLSSRVLYEERATQGDKRVTGLILMMEKVVSPLLFFEKYWSTFIFEKYSSATNFEKIIEPLLYWVVIS
jgi:hypothetical protein